MDKIYLNDYTYEPEIFLVEDLTNIDIPIEYVLEEQEQHQFDVGLYNSRHLPS